MITKVTAQHFRDQSTVGDIFVRVAYDEVEFWKCRYVQCTWDDCRFSRVTFSHGTVFSGCRFVKCRFFKQHTYFGGPSLFQNCVFEKCEIENVQFFEAAFEDCTFTGSLTNVLFYGPLAPPEWQSSFRNVDLSRATLDMVGFESGFDLSTTKLPANRFKR